MERQLVLLRNLAHFDIDAVGTFDAAIARVSAAEVTDRLRMFRQDHLRHVQELNDALSRLGGTGVDFKPDFKGALLKGFTSITSLMGTDAALAAMFGNEQLCMHAYHSAVKLAWDEATRLMVERHFKDEQHHLGWIRGVLRERLWEPGEAEAHA